MFNFNKVLELKKIMKKICYDKKNIHNTNNFHIYFTIIT